MHRKTNNGNTKYSFHVGELNNETIITCKISGIISTIKNINLPIRLEQNHPVAIPENALKIISAYNKNKDWKNAESQLIAGCILSLLSSKGKTTNYPMSSATEANMMLQSAGNQNLIELATIIIDRWNSDQTWIRIPKLSFDLAAYQYPSISMGDVISKYSRLIRKALSLEELPPQESQEIYKSFKENSLKNARDKNNKSIEWNEKLANHYINEMKEKRSTDIDKQINSAKVFFKNLKEHMPKELTIQCAQTLNNMNLISAKKKAELAMSIRTIFIGTDKSSMANNLAYILENAQVDLSEEDMLGFSESVSPIEKTEKPKTLREIMAEKGIRS
jgi:6-pyruvoyl-tetrahydropterin synthase